jgi:hypothetical protein
MGQKIDFLNLLANSNTSHNTKQIAQNTAQMVALQKEQNTIIRNLQQQHEQANDLLKQQNVMIAMQYMEAHPKALEATALYTKSYLVLTEQMIAYAEELKALESKAAAVDQEHEERRRRINGEGGIFGVFSRETRERRCDLHTKNKKDWEAELTPIRASAESIWQSVVELNQARQELADECLKRSGSHSLIIADGKVQYCGLTLADASEQKDFDQLSQDAKLALQLFIEQNKVSTSMLQTYLRLGHGRAARAVFELESHGMIAPSPSGIGKIVVRPILGAPRRSIVKPAMLSAPSVARYDVKQETSSVVEVIIGCLPVLSMLSIVIYSFFSAPTPNQEVAQSDQTPPIENVSNDPYTIINTAVAEDGVVWILVAGLKTDDANAVGDRAKATLLMKKATTMNHELAMIVDSKVVFGCETGTSSQYTACIKKAGGQTAYQKEYALHNIALYDLSTKELLLYPDNGKSSYHKTIKWDIGNSKLAN